MNPSDLSAVRGRHGIWHGAVEYERGEGPYGGYLWGEEGLTWCGHVLSDPTYDEHALTCKKCLAFLDSPTSDDAEEAAFNEQ